MGNSFLATHNLLSLLFEFQHLTEHHRHGSHLLSPDSAEADEEKDPEAVPLMALPIIEFLISLNIVEQLMLLMTMVILRHGQNSVTLMGPEFVFLSIKILYAWSHQHVANVKLLLEELQEVKQKWFKLYIKLGSLLSGPPILTLIPYNFFKATIQLVLWKGGRKDRESKGSSSKSVSFKTDEEVEVKPPVKKMALMKPLAKASASKKVTLKVVRALATNLAKAKVSAKPSGKAKTSAVPVVSTPVVEESDEDESKDINKIPQGTGKAPCCPVPIIEVTKHPKLPKLVTAVAAKSSSTTCPSSKCKLVSSELKNQIPPFFMPVVSTKGERWTLNNASRMMDQMDAEEEAANRHSSIANMVDPASLKGLPVDPPCHAAKSIPGQASSSTLKSKLMAPPSGRMSKNLPKHKKGNNNNNKGVGSLKSHQH
ncbi:hypothetical protein C8J56DRAFT_881648 [Mycena floridula]|nr:hypothetical protein C8J56DRAFT_881648 [Mycena floridula]